MKYALAISAVCLHSLFAQVPFNIQNIDYLANSPQYIISAMNSEDFSPVRAGDIVFTLNKISERRNGFDYLSLTIPQQLWQDYNNPQNLHAVFTFSEQSSVFSDRSCLYFGSTDEGESWFELGEVPDSVYSGYPAICGLSNGAAIIANHNRYFDNQMHTSLFLDNEPFANNFSGFDPGLFMNGPVYPRLITTFNDKIVFASGTGNYLNLDFLILNTFDPSTNQFSGWQEITSGRSGEEYDFSISTSGKIGVAYLGQFASEGDVLYMESTDDGITWSTPITVFDRDINEDTTIAVLRSVSLNFSGEDPCIAYATCKVIFSSYSYYRDIPNAIQFWSPAVNNGIPETIIDSSNVPFYPVRGTNDVFIPVCRPAMARAGNSYLFVAFSASTGDIYPSQDTTNYFATYLTYSSDGGNKWSDPVRITPEQPVYDWRYTSIPEIIPIINNEIKINIVMEGDTIPGSNVNSRGMPVGVTAQYYHFSGSLYLTGVENQSRVSRSFKLYQNFPNPFNPKTNIIFKIPESSYVQLRVYDVLGNVVSTLISEVRSAGSYSVGFNGTGLASGIYFYQLESGSFTETKKLILLK